MRPFQLNSMRVRALGALSIALWILSGCAVVGPSSLSSGRVSYNEAINTTEDEQLLSSIVKGRYGETFSLLSVSGVAANVRFRADAGINVGFGPPESYDGRLVPFSGGLVYEENPTITYKPVDGEQYLMQLLSPIPLKLLVLILRSETNSSAYLNLLVRRINDLRNPDFKVTAGMNNNGQFSRFTELSQLLGDAGIIQWVDASSTEIPFEILISGYAPSYIEQVREFLTLLGLPGPGSDSEEIVVPVYFAIKRGKMGDIAISTRSTYDLIEMLSASVKNPAGACRLGSGPGLSGSGICRRTNPYPLFQKQSAYTDDCGEISWLLVLHR